MGGHILAGKAAANDASHSIPELLARNARKFGLNTAYREKEFGIWQSWTWLETAEEIRAIALGLLSLGIEKGDYVAIIGRNRPALYWSMVAAQMVGAIPVPLYQDAVAEEMAYVLENCGARFVVAADQEQVDKVLEVQERVKVIDHVVYLDPRGLRKYDHSRLHSLHDVQAEGRAAHERFEGELKQRVDAITYDDTCVMLYTSGTTGRPKGVVLSNRNIIETSKNSSEFDHLKPGDEILAYLPMAWVGDFIFSIGQAYWTGFCVNCPESADTMMTDLREIGPTYYFAPPRVFETQLTNVMIRMEDAGRFKKWLFRIFMDHRAARSGQTMLDGKPVGGWDRFKYRLGESVRLRAAEEHARVQPGARRLYRRRGDRAGDFRLLPLARDQPETALWPDRSHGLHHRSSRMARCGRIRLACRRPGVELKIAENGEVFYRSPGVFVEYFKNPESTAGTKDRRGLGRDGRCRVHRARDRASADHRPGQGCGQDGRRVDCSRRNMSRTS